MSTEKLSDRIAATIYRNGPCTADRVCELLPEMSRKALIATIGRMRTKGDVVENGEVLSLHADVRQRFARLEKEALQLAGPRSNIATRPIQSWRLPSAYGTREGSNDYRSWLSVYARAS